MASAERVYLAACPHCGYAVQDLQVRGIDVDTACILELATCPKCRVVFSAEIPPVSSRLKEYIRQIEATVVQLRRRREAYVENLQRRVLELKDSVEAGQATPQERARYSRTIEKLNEVGSARLPVEPQDVPFLEERLRIAGKALEKASDGPFPHTCGEELVIHEDSPGGYQITCPHCSEEMVVRLQAKGEDGNT